MVNMRNNNNGQGSNYNN
jgi:hypothetical protein